MAMCLWDRPVDKMIFCRFRSKSVVHGGGLRNTKYRPTELSKCEEGEPQIPPCVAVSISQLDVPSLSGRQAVNLIPAIAMRVSVVTSLLALAGCSETPSKTSQSAPSSRSKQESSAGSPLSFEFGESKPAEEETGIRAANFPAWALAAWPDASKFATTSGHSLQESTIEIWDATLQKRIHSIERPPGLLLHLAISPDGQTLAVSRENRLELWDTSAWKLRCDVRAHDDLIWGISFSPDGSRIATCSKDRSIRIASSVDGSPRVWITSPRDLDDVQFSPNGELLTAVDESESLKIWRCDSGEVAKELSPPVGRIVEAAWSPTGSLLACATFEGDILFWNTNDWSHAFTLEGPPGVVGVMVFSPDGTWLLTGSTDGVVGAWHIRDRTLVQLRTDHDKMIQGIAVLPALKSVATLDYNGKICISHWPVASPDR